MADVTVKYKGSTIAEMSEEGTKTLKTSGKYCEGDIEVSYSPAPVSSEVNCKIYDITLAKSGGWVELITLDAELKAHINDPTFRVMLAIDSEYAYVNYSGSFFVASNTPFAKQNSYPIYGYAHRQTTETVTQITYIYYPANNTDTSTSLGGNGMFRTDGSKYYIKPADGFVRAGNYKLIFTW